MASGSDESIYWIITSGNYNFLLHFQDSCIYGTSTINTVKVTASIKHEVKSSTIQLLNCLELRLPDEFSVSQNQRQSYFTTGGFTANQFILASGLLRPTTRDLFFQLNSCCSTPYVTSSLTRRWV
jgi:hypothetical protein